jgi:hypothetical protein
VVAALAEELLVFLHRPNLTAEGVVVVIVILRIFGCSKLTSRVTWSGSRHMVEKTGTLLMT